MIPAVRTRFAPSPTGLLHLGNVRTALFNALLARGRGAFILRIEDTDRERSREDYARAIETDLRWLGLDWQEGPGRTGGETYFQSRRTALYHDYFERLEARGLAYPCFCTEQELALSRKTALAAGRPPRYAGRCYAIGETERRRRRAAGERASLRFHVPAGAEARFEDRVRGEQRFASDDVGDFVIRRSDGTPAFFFSNAVDDALMRVTLVLRGEDHLSNTPRQIFLLRALDLPIPEYAHIPLVVREGGAPLSKRTGSRSVSELRDEGFLPLAIANYLARLGHTYADNRLMSLDALAAGFDLARVGKAPARYDEAQLLHWQREAVRHAHAAELGAWMQGAHERVPPQDLSRFIEAMRANVLFPRDAQAWADRLYSDDTPDSEEARAAIAAAPAGFFGSAARAAAEPPEAFADAVKRATGLSGKRLYQPLRAALSGVLEGPELPVLIALMGRERVRARLERARELNDACSKSTTR